MKKLLLLGTLLASLSTVFGQGSFALSTSSRWVWDNAGTAPTNPGVSNKLHIAFLLGSGQALISGFGFRVPTNATTLGLGFDVDEQAAWYAILNDPNYKFATNANTGQLVVASTSNLGGVVLPGSTFVQGTSASGGTIRMIMVGWTGPYADPWAASAIPFPSIGWSAFFDYHYVQLAGTPLSINVQDVNGVTKFGVWQFIPEPSAFAMTALAAATLWIRRRRAIA